LFVVFRLSLLAFCHWHRTTNDNLQRKLPASPTFIVFIGSIEFIGFLSSSAAFHKFFNQKFIE